MIRWMAVLFVSAGLAIVAGCEEECVVGECVNDGECFEECLEVCEGDVIDAVCTFDEICDCECELGCFF
ncbi:MAG: hypothetical protein AAF500_01460 [Myxococcota bacterium]